MELPENTANWIVSALTGLVGWLWKSLNGRLDVISERLNRHELHLAANYLTKEETRANFNDIKETLKDQNTKLDKIIDEVSRKADRTCL